MKRQGFLRPGDRMVRMILLLNILIFLHASSRFPSGSPEFPSVSKEHPDNQENIEEELPKYYSFEQLTKHYLRRRTADLKFDDDPYAKYIRYIKAKQALSVLLSIVNPEPKKDNGEVGQSGSSDVGPIATEGEKKDEDSENKSTNLFSKIFGWFRKLTTTVLFPPSESPSPSSDGAAPESEAVSSEPKHSESFFARFWRPFKKLWAC